MKNKDLTIFPRRLTLCSIAVAMLGFSATASALQIEPGLSKAGSAPVMLAETVGMDRRQDRREDRRDDRQDRRGDRQDCRQEEGVVGKDKRDCKQDERQERRDD